MRRVGRRNGIPPIDSRKERHSFVSIDWIARRNAVQLQLLGGTYVRRPWAPTACRGLLFCAMLASPVTYGLHGRRTEVSAALVLEVLLVCHYCLRVVSCRVEISWDSARVPRYVTRIDL